MPPGFGRVAFSYLFPSAFGPFKSVTLRHQTAILLKSLQVQSRQQVEQVYLIV